ncbi:hypothetical protein L218DRAFT_1082111 [Marasmius fiardii PR-910]|nr:hypothetical protein L218DRAFT_1082111 [Marasmius fiardii PR-910]
MEVLSGATRINIDRSHFSNVGRDQYNDCTIHQTIVEKRAKIHRGLPEFSEFSEVKRGDIYKDKDVCYSWRLCSNGKDDTEAAVYTAQIMIAGRFGDSKFTVKTYHGRNGKKEWRRDFLRCSRDWHGDVPLFGYNKSSVPLLIFHGELVPIAHIEAQVGWVGLVYLEMLRKSLRCSRNELWMDPTKGSFCRGPVGPKCRQWSDRFHIDAIPSDIEFLKENVVIRYFSNIKNDLGLIAVLAYSSHFEHVIGVFSTYYPHLISSLTNSTIASIRNARWFSRKGCLGDQQRMADGSTRFLLTDHGRHIEVESMVETYSWLSQALSVFHVHNIWFNEDLSNFKFIDPYFKVKGALQKLKHKRQQCRLGRPIYLFLLPSPSPDTHFYFWSHNPSGQDLLSSDMCRYLGLPITFSISLDYYQYSWPTKVYKALHDHQVVRGFDPTTTDFVEFLGYPILEIMSPENHFQEVDIEEAKDTSNSCEDDGQVSPGSTHLVPEATRGSLLNMLTNWFTLDSVESAGISAAVF